MGETRTQKTYPYIGTVYHPCTKTGDNEKYACFFDMLDTLLSQLPAKSDIIMGTNINSNIGTVDNTHFAKFCPALGPHGLKKHNKKARASYMFTSRTTCAS